MFHKDIRLSKSLTWLLRHGACEEGFDLRKEKKRLTKNSENYINIFNELNKGLNCTLWAHAFEVHNFMAESPEGYLEVYKILQHPLFASKYQVADIVRVVNQDVKQRFKLRRTPSTGHLAIKANQGHSIPEISNEGLTPILTPKYSTVVHGTYYKWWSSIEADGLNRMSRNHIHFAKGTLDDTSVISGLRQSAQILIYINLPKALADGYKFFESENGVILTSGNHRGFLKPEYFLKAVCVKTGKL